MEDGQDQPLPITEAQSGSSDQLRQLIREEITAAMSGPSTSSLPAASGSPAGEKRECDSKL